MLKPVITKGDDASRRAYSRWHYRQNKELYKARAVAHNLAQRVKVREMILAFLKLNPCVDCGEADPIVLEFDHKQDCTKYFNLGDAARRGMSLTSVKSGIGKCEIRCANCHRRKTYKDRKFRHKE